MAIIPIDTAHVQQMVQNDAQQLRTFVQWAQARYQAYNQNLGTAAQMTAAGITSTADQNALLAFIADLNNIVLLARGTLPTAATNMSNDLQALIGIL